MANNSTTEVVVIGAGPGGYVGALRAAQLGKQVTVIEREAVGGVCLNVGCIPSKALITAAKLVEKIRSAETMGISAGEVKVDVPKLQSWKEGVVKKLTGGVGQLFKAAGVSHVAGTARFVGPNEVEVDGPGGAQRIRFESCIIATGSRPIEIPGFPFDGVDVVDSTGGLAFGEVPPRLCVIGGGYIGLEMGTMWSKLGSHVTVLEMLDQLLPGTDPDLVRVVERKLKRKKIDVHLKSRASGFKKMADGLQVSVATAAGDIEIACDKILVSVGRRPVSDGLDLAKAGIATDERGFIPTNERCQTQVPHIYAVGDIAGGAMLAHKAYREGEVAAEVIAGQASAFDVRCIPAVIFTDPEIAYAGVSEPEAREAGTDILVGKFNFAANGRALTSNEGEGFVKVIAGKADEDILGVAIVGPGASDLIAEACLAIEMNALVPDVGLTIHAHPTLPETLLEAARDALGEAVHAVRKRR